MASDYEPIEYDVGEVRELFDSCIFVGTITQVKHDVNKADVETEEWGTISDIPIHYHCPDSETVDDGHLAFEEDDSVYVLHDGSRFPLSASTLKIVGFVVGLKDCVYRFYIKPKFNTLYAEKGEQAIGIKFEWEAQSYEIWAKTHGSEWHPDPQLPVGVAGPFEIPGKAAKNLIDIDIYVACGPPYRPVFIAQYEVFDPAEASFYLPVDRWFKIVSEKTAENLLFQCSKTQIEVEGSHYDCYEAHFTQLKVTRRRCSEVTLGNPRFCNFLGCHNEDLWFRYMFETRNLMPACLLGPPPPGFPCIDPSCPHPCGGGPANIPAEERCIFTDENGNNASFIPTYYNCPLEGPPLLGEWWYEMIDTPQEVL